MAIHILILVTVQEEAQIALQQMGQYSFVLDLVPLLDLLSCTVEDGHFCFAGIGPGTASHRAARYSTSCAHIGWAMVKLTHKIVGVKLVLLLF